MQAMSLAEDDQEAEQPERITDIREMVGALLMMVKNHDRQFDELRQVWITFETIICSFFNL